MHDLRTSQEHSGINSGSDTSVAAAAMMRMADGDGQGIGSVVAVIGGFWQQHANHEFDLRFVAVAHAYHGLFDGVGRVFRDQQTGSGRYKHRDAAGLAELERCAGILVDKGVFNSRFIWPVAGQHLHQAVVQLAQPFGKAGLAIGLHRTRCHEAKAAALAFDDTPAGVAQAGIYANDADSFRHDFCFESGLSDSVENNAGLQDER